MGASTGAAKAFREVIRAVWMQAIFLPRRGGGHATRQRLGAPGSNIVQLPQGIPAIVTDTLHAMCLDPPVQRSTVGPLFLRRA
jgi:hypothetical protein